MAAVAGAMAAATVPLLAPAMADVRAGAEAWARGDYSRAIAEWRGPALAGDADAQFNMGQAYKLGRGVPADLPQAEEWYRKAAMQGHAQAQDNYGLALFQDGRKADALPWLEKSAARDEKRTELVLGTMLFNGDAVPKDWVRAYALVSRSSQQGLPQASQTLAQMDGFLSPEQRQQGVALAGRMADQARATQMAGLAASPPRPAGARPSPAAVTSSMPQASSAPASLPMPMRRRGKAYPAMQDPEGQAPGTPAPRPSPSIATADMPPSTAPSRGQPVIDAGSDNAPAMAGPPIRTARVSPPRRDVPSGKPVSAPERRPAPAVVAGGRWRVQLGAFRDEGNARALWSRIGGRVGGQPGYVHAGGVTRLQAGPFASRADAQRACRASGTSCVVLP